LKIYIPSNFIFENFFPDLQIQKDKYCYILHKIYEERIFGKENKRSQFVNLKASILRFIIGRWHYKEVLNNLLNSNIIQTDNHYIVGEKSKAYKLIPPFSESKHKCIELRDESMLKRIAKHKEIFLSKAPQGIEYKMLNKYLNDIEINSNNAIRYVKKYYSNDIEKFNSYLLSIKFIQTKNFHWTVDDIAGRVHTNITTLFRPLRRYLRYKGKPLINIDICNSQPFLFNILIKNYFNLKMPRNYKYDNFSNKYKDTYGRSKNNYGKSSLESNKSYIYSYDGHLNKDVLLYEWLTSQGKFYEYLMEKMNIPLSERQSFKIKVFGRIFFCRNNKNYVREEMKIFKTLFPTVSKVIEFYKEEDYTQLPISLQKAESEIMINDICKRISLERPDIFITTIHDSILTTEENERFISNIILDEFEEKYNLKPKLKVE